MPDELADAHSLPLIPATAREVAHLDHVRYRKLRVRSAIGLAAATLKSVLLMGWPGIAFIAAIGGVVIPASRLSDRISARRLCDEHDCPDGFVAWFEPLFSDVTTLRGHREWRARSYLALLTIQDMQLCFRPGEKGRLKGRRDWSIPVAWCTSSSWTMSGNSNERRVLSGSPC